MDNTASQINSVIDNLANKLGTTVSNVYPMLVKQAAVDAWVNLTFMILSMIAIITTIIYTYKTYAGYDSDGNCAYTKAERKGQEKVIVITTIALCILSFIGLIVILCCFNDTITAFANPQYYALQKLLDIISK